MQNEIKKQAHEYHQQGYSYAEIGNLLGISKSAAYRIINETESADSEITEHRPRGQGKKITEAKDDPNVALKLRRLELDHEEKMERIRLEKVERERMFDSELLKWQRNYDDLIELIEKKKERIEKLEDELKYLKENANNPKPINTEISSKVHTLGKTIHDLDYKTIEKDEFDELYTKLYNIREQVIKECLRLGNIYKKVPEAIVLDALMPVFREINDEFESKGFFSNSYVRIQLKSSVKSIITNYL